MKRSKNLNKVVWITGASSGIGEQLCILLATEGWQVVASARRRENLEKLREQIGNNCHPFPVDITSKSNVDKLVKEVEDNIGPIDLAILNAGFYEPEKDSFDFEISKKTIDINVMGTINCIAAIKDRFLERESGHLALMSSIAGYRGLPYAPSYTASRATIINLAESLRLGFFKKGVKVQVICPGFVDSPLTQKNSFHMPMIMSSKDAAYKIVRGLDKKSFEISFPYRLSMTMKFLSILPYRIYFPLMSRYSRK